MDRENPYQSMVFEKKSGGQGFSRSITRVDTKRVPAVNFSYQGVLVQTYIRCHGSSSNQEELLQLIWKLHKIDSTWLIIDPTYFFPQ
jgi:hypothetical protein